MCIPRVLDPCIGYWSAHCPCQEQGYAQIKKEALGLTWACKWFQDYLLGRSFYLKTNHKPLVLLLARRMLMNFKFRSSQVYIVIHHVRSNDWKHRLSKLRLRSLDNLCWKHALSHHHDIYQNCYCGSVIIEMPSWEIAGAASEHWKLAEDGLSLLVLL